MLAEHTPFARGTERAQYPGMHRDPSSHRSTIRALTAFSIAAGVLAAARGPARADCASPVPKVLWTYPADGERDVPVDTVFWIVSNTWGAQPAVTLNDRTIDPADIANPIFDASWFSAGELDPDTDYVLHLAYGDGGELDAGSTHTFDIAFHTGSTHAKRPDKPVVSGYHTTPGIPDSHICKDVIGAQDCFDTGQDTLFEFDVASEGAIAWLVHTHTGIGTLWPKRCGDPALFMYGQVSPGCITIQAIGVGGASSDIVNYCKAEAANPDAGFPDASSTGAGSGGRAAHNSGNAPSAMHRGVVDAGATSRAKDPDASSDSDDGCSVIVSRAGIQPESLLPFLALLPIVRRAQRKR